MTLLEQIITQQVGTSVTTTLSRVTERIAEEMAEEILKDPAFRAHMRELVQRAFDQTLTALGTDPAQ